MNCTFLRTARRHAEQTDGSEADVREFHLLSQ